MSTIQVAARKSVAGISALIQPAIITLLFVLVLNQDLLERLLRLLFPNEAQYLYGRATLATLLWEHVALVALSSVIAALIGLTAGIFVTRNVGRPFLPYVRKLSSLAQTFPPVAVLALVAPALGYGFRPTIIALSIYSILPILNNTISGIMSIPAEYTEVARGMGMTRRQVLFLSELPLAARVILAGVRTSIIINIGTATIGAVIGAGGIGVIIIAGLVRNNTAFVFTGAITAALLAFAADWCFARCERLLFAARGRSIAR